MPEPFDGDPYVTLRVPPSASASEIRRAFHRLAKQHHPDVDGSAGAVAEMARINAAYEILSDPPRRKAWDEVHRPGAPRPTGPTAPRSAGARGRPGRPPTGTPGPSTAGPRSRGPATATGTRSAARGTAAASAAAGTAAGTAAGSATTGPGGVPRGTGSTAAGAMGARPGGAPPAPPVTARDWRRRRGGRRRIGWLVAVGAGAFAVVGAIAWGWWSGLGGDAGVAVVGDSPPPSSLSPADRSRTTYQALTYELRTTGSPRTARDATVRLRGTGDDDGTYCEITRDADGRIMSAWIVLAGTSRDTPVTVSINDQDGDVPGGNASALLTAGAGPKRREYTWDPARARGTGSFVWSPEGTMALEATLEGPGGSELGVIASFSCGAVDPPQ